MLSLLLSTTCAGKLPSTAGSGGESANPGRVSDSVPERKAATRSAATKGDSERFEDRFAAEAARQKRQEREAAKKAEAERRRRIDVVDSKDAGPPR